jgi:hypothetical protein
LLLDAEDGDIADLVLAPIRGELVIDLAAAGDDAPHALRGDSLDFADHVLEPALARSSSDETASLCRSRLFGLITISGRRQWRSICRRKQVIDLRGRRRHADLHVVLGAELQIALGPGGRVLGPWPS